MANNALRVLGLGSLKRIYRLDVPEVCTALQDAARRRVDDQKVWDAMLYRVALLRPELRPVDLALTFDALAKVRRREDAFLDYLMQEVRAKAKRFLVRDAALLLNGFAKLAVRDELLTSSLVPSIVRRLSERSRWEDVALLALAFARLGDKARTVVFDRVVAAAMPRIDRLDDGHALSLLACAFTRPRPPAASEAAAALGEGGARRGGAAPAGGEALFAEDAMGILGPDEDEEGGIPHLAFVEVVLAQCERHMWNFHGGDVLHLALALSTLARGGHEDVFPPRLLKRMEKRIESLHFELLPVQFVRLLEVLAHLPELEKQCAGKLLDEVAYRMRHVTPQSCISVLRTVRRLGGHARAHSAAAWRLTREDAASSLLPAEVCEVAEAFVALRPQASWESREALLCLLQGLQRRRKEPELAVLARLLRAYGELGVRDTHWFHLCSKLSVCDLSGPTPSKPRLPGKMPPLDEQVAADALLALARLNLPHLVDAAALFSRAAECISSPRPAAVALEAAAIIGLVGRRPHELRRPAAVLAPLVERVLGGSSAELPRELRLFPFTDLGAGACQPEVLLSWRRAAAQVHGAQAAADAFDLALGRELSSWSGVDSVPAVQIGPLRVPWALGLVSLAEHLRANPLDGPRVQASWEDDIAHAHSGGALASNLPSDSDGDDCGGEPAAARPLPGGRRRSRRGRSASVGVDVEAFGDIGRARPETHVLVVPLREADFFHASATLRGERQRAKAQLLGASRYAEVSLLRRLGWRVICVSELLWSWGPDNDAQTSRQNKELIFRLVASLGNEPS